MSKLIYDMTFEEEKLHNDPYIGFKWVAENYRNTGLYEWEDVTFANTHLVNPAARHFKKFGRFTDIDPKDEIEYAKFYDRWEYRRKNGMVVPIIVPKGGAISDKDLIDAWVPGAMVGMCNFGPIERAKNPDDDITIEDALQKSIDDDQRRNKENRLKELFAGLSDRKVAEVTYDFPDFWDGHYHTWLSIEFAAKLGLDISVVKARRKGFSYIGAWDAFNEYDLNPYSLTLLIAYDMTYLTKADGLFTFVKKYADFMNKHTDWYKGRLVDTQKEIKAGFKYQGDSAEYGFLSRILCLSARDNPSCARGKLANKIKWEECGTFPNLLATIESTKAAAEAGGFIVGQSTYWGTVGSESAEYANLRELFYNPESQDCLKFNNVYDKNKKGTACGLFFGQYQNYMGAMDKWGNSDFEKAALIHNKRRDKKKELAGTKEFLKWQAERPTTPAEALNRKAGSIFNTIAIEEQLHRLDTEEHLKHLGANGKLVRSAQGVKFITNEELRLGGHEFHLPINTFYMEKGSDMHGCVTRYFAPFKKSRVEKDGTIVSTVPQGLYYIWHDPFALNKDKNKIHHKRDSVGSAFVYEKANGVTPSKGDRLVATLIGRPDDTDKYNEQLFLLAEYYNVVGGIGFENDRGDVFGYAKRYDKDYRYISRLMEEPDLLSKKEIAGKTGRKYGINMTIARKLEAARLLKETLNKKVGTNPITGEDILFVHYIYCKRTLEELLVWDLDGNFDCVSALLVGELYKADLTDKIIEELYNHEGASEDFWSRDLF